MSHEDEQTLQTASGEEPAEKPPVTPGGRVGRGLLLVLAPQVVIGAYLTLVPDEVAFDLSQAAVLLHVVLCLVTVPVVIWLFAKHFVHTQSSAQTERHRPMVSRVARWLAFLMMVVAFATGFAVLFDGDIGQSALWHSIAGLALGVPIAAHFFLDGTRRLAVATAVSLGATVVACMAIAQVVSMLSPATATPEFAFELRNKSDYELAAWCGECHGAIYDEWSQSAHARTMELAVVREDIGSKRNEIKRDIDLVDVDKSIQSGKSLGVLAAHDLCRQCHAPTAFYGEEPKTILEATGVSAEGVTCSYCHTVRGAKPFASRAPAYDKDISRVHAGFISDSLPLLGYHISRPDLVRRYWGQSSSNPTLRWIGNMLIRWRADIHRADYHSDYAADPRFCVGCHGGAGDYLETPFKSYPEWKKSKFNTGDLATTTTCQDCHMALEPGEKPAPVPGRLVDWGPERPRRRSHLFLGGNARFHTMMKNKEMAKIERRYTKKGLRVSLKSVTAAEGRLTLAVEVAAPGVGHTFPAMESQIRYTWLEIRASASDGKEIFKSSRGKKWPPAFDDWSSPLLYREIPDENGGKVDDRVVPAGGSRMVEVGYDVAVADRVTRVDVELWTATSGGALKHVWAERDKDGRFVIADPPSGESGGRVPAGADQRVY